MLTKRIIPCLDVKEGRVVKAVSFVNLRDAGDPVAQASFYAEAGADELTFLDIGASPDGRGTLVKMVERVADSLFIPFMVGGGVRTVEDFRALLRAGADKVSINTGAIENPQIVAQVAENFGSQCIAVAIDAAREPEAKVASDSDDWGRTEDTESGIPSSSRWQVYTYGGRRKTGRDAIEWARQVERLGAGEILLTSIDRDGTQLGFDLELTREVEGAVNIPIIASGGAGGLNDFALVLTEGKADAALAASLFHDRIVSIGQVKQSLREHGIPVR